MRVAAICLAIPALSTCSAERGSEADDRTSLRGVELAEPFLAPEFELPDTQGRPFRFRERTAGHLALLFFGFTNCPDICPVHLSNIAAVLGDLPYVDRRRVQVVFVSVDPQRDTPERIRAYLDRWSSDFVGLSGPLDEVNRVQAAYRLPPAVAQQIEGRSDYVVGHASQVLAITPDGKVRAAYPSGLRQADWAHDLPLLIGG